MCICTGQCKCLNNYRVYKLTDLLVSACKLKLPLCLAIHCFIKYAR